MASLISVIIPNYNGAATIGKCLQSAMLSDYDNFEIIVVDDGSTDASLDIIRRYPCEVIRLGENEGAAKARNIGARKSQGDILFFTDADCLLKKDALSVAYQTVSQLGPEVVVGGTYTRMPYDKKFFSIFQSVFIHYSELKSSHDPDYIATHALIIDRQLFEKSGGFPVEFMPILEDVEFSHRLRRRGIRLIINPQILVRHVFNYSFLGSIKNAIKKAKYWTAYSLGNKDLFSDSGTASAELKISAVSCLMIWALLIEGHFAQQAVYLYPAALIFFFNLIFNRKLILAFYETQGLFFAVPATLYFTLLYPLAVGLGAAGGIMMYISGKEK